MPFNIRLSNIRRENPSRRDPAKVAQYEVLGNGVKDRSVPPGTIEELGSRSLRMRLHEGAPKRSGGDPRRTANGSLQFDLCRRDHRQAFVIGLDDSREFHVFGFPALMDKFSCERRLSTEFPNEPVLVREITGRHGDLGTFFSPGDRSDLEMFLQDLPAPLTNEP